MKIITKINNGKFYCGFCGIVTISDVRQSKGKGHHATVSSAIICKDCGRLIPQRNQLK